MRGLSQGQHQLSVIARDFLGNEAGTFDSRLTNIESRINTTLRISPKLISSQAPNIKIDIPRGSNDGDIFLEIYLFAEANDTDGAL